MLLTRGALPWEGRGWGEGKAVPCGSLPRCPGGHLFLKQQCPKELGLCSVMQHLVLPPCRTPARPNFNLTRAAPLVLCPSSPLSYGKLVGEDQSPRRVSVVMPSIRSPLPSMCASRKNKSRFLRTEKSIAKLKPSAVVLVQRGSLLTGVFALTHRCGGVLMYNNFQGSSFLCV